MGHGGFEGIKENSKVSKVGAAEDHQYCTPQQQKNDCCSGEYFSEQP